MLVADEAFRSRFPHSSMWLDSEGRFWPCTKWPLLAQPARHTASKQPTEECQSTRKEEKNDNRIKRSNKENE
jgi:hypothetical protein